MHEVTILVDSVNTAGDRLTTFKLTYPRFMHSEFLTHRMLSRNSSSSRAIPVERMIERVQRTPFHPSEWYKNGRGMASRELADSETAGQAGYVWNRALHDAIGYASDLAKLGIHKSIVNRLLEPFAHIDTIVSATEWANFFALRVSPDAQPEFRQLTGEMLDAYRHNAHYGNITPVEDGGWHIPYGDRLPPGLSNEGERMIAVARIARLSYATHDGDIDAGKDLALAQQLVKDGHWSPFEHVAMAAPNQARPRGNFYGWIQLRKMYPSENRTWDDVTTDGERGI